MHTFVLWLTSLSPWANVAVWVAIGGGACIPLNMCLNKVIKDSTDPAEAFKFIQKPKS